MKPKRVILIFDVDYHVPSLRVVLDSRGYRTVSATSVEQLEAALKHGGIDAVLVGYAMEQLLNHLFIAMPQITVPTAVRGETEDMSSVLEKLRIALVRKRGPKPAAEKERRTA